MSFDNRFLGGVAGSDLSAGSKALDATQSLGRYLSRLCHDLSADNETPEKRLCIHARLPSVPTQRIHVEVSASFIVSLISTKDQGLAQSAQN